MSTELKVPFPFKEAGCMTRQEYIAHLALKIAKQLDGEKKQQCTFGFVQLGFDIECEGVCGV